MPTCCLRITDTVKRIDSLLFTDFVWSIKTCLFADSVNDEEQTNSRFSYVVKQMIGVTDSVICCPYVCFTDAVIQHHCLLFYGFGLLIQLAVSLRIS